MTPTTFTSSKASKALKWSGAAELTAKLIGPLSTMALARLLTPEAFGCLAIALMITSLADTISDAGIQKYLIHKNLKGKKALSSAASTALFFSVATSVAIALAIHISAPQIAYLLNSPENTTIVEATAIYIPVSAAGMVHSALLRRRLDFKSLFTVRVTCSFLPLFLTLPLAYITLSPIVLIIGLIAQKALETTLLWIKCRWAPRPVFSLKILGKILPYSSFTGMEALGLWLTTYLDIFIVARALDTHHVGLYRVATTTVGQFTGLFTASIMPVVFAVLSKLQDSPSGFKEALTDFRRKTAFFIFPLCMTIFLYSDTFTSLLLGDKWFEISQFISLWALTGIPVILISFIAAEALKGGGRPGLSMLSQLQHLAVMAIAVALAAGYGFDTLCNVRSWIRLEGVVFNLLLMYVCFRETPTEALRPLLSYTLAAMTMIPFSFLFTYSTILAPIMAACGIITYFLVTMAIVRENHFIKLISLIPLPNKSNSR